jgi:hypothetical protein
MSAKLEKAFDTADTVKLSSTTMECLCFNPGWISSKDISASLILQARTNKFIFRRLFAKSIAATTAPNTGAILRRSDLPQHEFTNQ